MTLRQWSEERERRSALVQLWQASGAAGRQPRATVRALRDPDVVAGRLALGRALLADALSVPSLAALPAAEAAAEARRVERGLALAERQAAALLAERPAAWEAALVLGGSRLLAAAQRGGDELYGQQEAWQAPLRYARHLAPAAPEPGRLLAIGLIASWHALSEPDRRAGRALLARELRDPATLRLLLPALAGILPELDELAAVLPDSAQAFDLLQQLERDEGDWRGLCAARERWRMRLQRELEAALANADRRFAFGDRHGATAELWSVIARSPREHRYAPLVADAVAALPPGPVSSDGGVTLTAWLRWALPLWLLDQEPLPPEVLGRIAGLVPELPAPEMALAALAAGELEKAEIWERRSERLWSLEWAPYAVAKTEALLARGHVAEAAETLAEVHQGYRDRWAYRRARAQLAAAQPPGGGTKGPQGPRGLGSAAWTYQQGEASLELEATAPAHRLTVAIHGAPEHGAAVELLLDGVNVGCFVVAPGGSIEAVVPLAEGPHHLALRELGRQFVVPGVVQLARSPAANPEAARSAPEKRPGDPLAARGS